MTFFHSPFKRASLIPFQKMALNNYTRIISYRYFLNVWAELENFRGILFSDAEDITPGFLT